jgi:phosphohistidine phosphatase
MEIILLRHGKAQDHTTGDFDSSRELVEKGIEQSKRAGLFIKNSNLLPELVLTSPLKRAKQTADHFCATANLLGAVTQSWLACGMAPNTALRELTKLSEFKRICLVGHEPDFSTFIAWLTHADIDAIKVKKGSLIMLEAYPPKRYGSITFVVPQQIMPNSSSFKTQIK